MNRLTQLVNLSGMGKRRLPDELIAEINGILRLEDGQRQLIRTAAGSISCSPTA